MLSKKGFTLIEIVVCLLLLSLVVVVISTSIVKTKNSRINKEWENLIDRVVSGTEVYFEEKFPSFVTEQGDMLISIDSIIKEGLIDEKELVDSRDNTKIKDKNDEKYKYVKVFVNKKESIEFEYPVKSLSYIKINPRIKIINKGTTENLIELTEVSICNKENVCDNTNNNSLIVKYGDIEISNKNNYTFNKQDNITLAYLYDDIVSYRFYKVIPSKCELVLNTDDSENLFLSLLGENIKKYQLEIDGEIQSVNNYTQEIVKNFLPNELSSIKEIKVKCYYDFSFAQTKTDKIDINYKYNIKFSDLTNSYKCKNKTIGSEPFILNYTGNCQVIDDGNDNWRVKLLTSGNLIFTEPNIIDIFLVGGGGGGGKGASWAGNCGGSGGGGGGGYTSTIKNIEVLNTKTYSITIGAGGGPKSNGTSTIFDIYSAKGGYAGRSSTNNAYDNSAVVSAIASGGAGGSGGGSGARNGGSFGGNGSGINSSIVGGNGQNSTTCEFGEGTTTGCTGGNAFAYSGGGGGGSPIDINYGHCAAFYSYSGGFGGIGGGGKGAPRKSYSNVEMGTAGEANTGGGGGGGFFHAAYNSFYGGSGVVVIRNAR